MKSKTIWILIADSKSAFVLEHTGRGSGLKAREDTMWKSDVRSESADQPGRSFSSASPARSAMEPHVKSQSEEELFAKVLMAKLAAGQNAGRFDQLVLCAGPKMLSALVDATGPILESHVKAHVQKNLINTPLAEMPDHFNEVIVL